MITLNDLPVVSGNGDKRIWTGTITGEFTVASAVEVIRHKFPPLHWTKKVWHKSIHPGISSNIWKLGRNICSTDENLKKRNFHLASRCILCRKMEENRDHMLWYCNFSETIWRWLGGMFNFKNPRSFEDIFKMTSNKSPAIKEIWLLSAFVSMKELWFLRNECTYGKRKVNLTEVMNRILKKIYDCDIRLKATMWNNLYDLQVIKRLGLKTRIVKSLIPKEVYFHLPSQGKILLCCDSASKGNPGAYGYGVVGRSHSGEFVVAISGGIGELAVQNGFLELVFNTDSQAVKTAFQSGRFPWFTVTRWGKICADVVSWSFSHSYREVNFSADNMENRGTTLAKGEKRIYGSKPSFLGCLESPDKVYFIFC
ncbi:uncharacterized protein LOC113359503 [Papaver somniferum]|uniref:uncharacterized protein LOC113359503 n=1 Tax=Papaver somniferum TaxID=3469 RepID=UPI000E7042F8|nr:uncharacterized protein LOC113359503 [Papaver somniferum]